MSSYLLLRALKETWPAVYPGVGNGCFPGPLIRSWRSQTAVMVSPLTGKWQVLLLYANQVIACLHLVIAPQGGIGSGGCGLLVTTQSKVVQEVAENELMHLAKVFGLYMGLAATARHCVGVGGHTNCVRRALRDSVCHLVWGKATDLTREGWDLKTETDQLPIAN